MRKRPNSQLPIILACISLLSLMFCGCGSSSSQSQFIGDEPGALITPPPADPPIPKQQRLMDKALTPAPMKKTEAIKQADKPSKKVSKEQTQKPKPVKATKKPVDKPPPVRLPAKVITPKASD